MTTPAATSTVYIHVIDDVINKVREEFINNDGSGESALNELQAIWEMKMIEAGVISGPIDRSSKPAPGGSVTPVHDLNVPYEGTEEYETPTAEILFPPTPLQTPIPTPLPGSVQTPLPGNVQTPLPGSVDNSSMYNTPTEPTSEYSTPVNDTGGSAETKPGKPISYMQPPSAWVNPRSSLDVNVAYMEGRDEVDRGTSHQPLTQDFLMMSSGKRKREDIRARYNNGAFIPQQDGAADPTFEVSQGGKEDISLGRYDEIIAANKEIPVHAASSLKIPQLDGPIPDPYDNVLSPPNMYNYQGVVSEDYNIANTPAPNYPQASTPAVAPPDDVIDDDDDEPLNEDDDDDDDLDDVDEGEELNAQHLVLAQFEKVTRTKNRWKCTLKDGIMHINNKDILFNKATGEFNF